MSAFRRRTSFAAPLIVIAACSGGKAREDPQPKRYPGPIWYVQSSGPDTCSASQTELGCPKDMMCNPPPPSEIKCPPFSKDKNWEHVVKKQDGTCAVLPAGCYEDKCLGAATDCPLPIGQSLPKADEPKADEPKPAP